MSNSGCGSGDGGKKSLRTRKFLAKSKKSLNAMSHKRLPQNDHMSKLAASLSGTRFFEEGYNVLIPKYNLGLS